MIRNKRDIWHASCHTETEAKIHIISMRKAEPHEIDTLSHYL